MKHKLRAKKIISGGQTGIDRGALDACLSAGFPVGGWCPKGRQAEDGRIDKKYPLQETNDSRYEIRTRLNVKDSDGTLIIAPEITISGGTLLTVKVAEELNKPFLVIVIVKGSEAELTDKILSWMNKFDIKILNIAGPRQSEWSEAYNTGYRITEKLIQNR